MLLKSDIGKNDHQEKVSNCPKGTLDEFSFDNTDFTDMLRAHSGSGLGNTSRKALLVGSSVDIL